MSRQNQIDLRKVIFIAAIFLGTIIIGKTFFNKVPPGYVGVVVDLFGDKKGVEDEEIHVGMHFIPPWKNVYLFPTFEQNETWEKGDAFDFQTSEGLACSAEVGITYHFRPDMIHEVFCKYRRGMYEITHVFIRNYIRDAINTQASKMKIEDLYSTGKEEFFQTVEKEVRRQLEPIGIEISRIYLIGRFHFPPNVIAALNSKIEAIQRAQQRENELRESEAEAKKLIAKSQGDAKCRLIEAKSIAKANEIISESLSGEILAKMGIDKWDGKLPMVISGGEQQVLMPIDVPLHKPKRTYD